MLGLILRKNDLFMIIYRLQVQASFNGWFEKKRKDNLDFDFETEIIVNCVSNFLTLERIQTVAKGMQILQA